MYISTHNIMFFSYHKSVCFHGVCAIVRPGRHLLGNEHVPNWGACFWQELLPKVFNSPYKDLTYIEIEAGQGHLLQALLQNKEDISWHGLCWLGHVSWYALVYLGPFGQRYPCHEHIYSSIKQYQAFRSL